MRDRLDVLHCHTDTVHDDRRRSEVPKNRRSDEDKQPAGGRRASRDAGMASTATRFARLGTRESQIQAAFDRVRFGSVILVLPVAGRKAGGGGRDTTASYLRIFVSSILPSARAARQCASPLICPPLTSYTRPAARVRTQEPLMPQVGSNTVHDVVVVGSGAGGGTVTNVLANMGISVLLLEAGPMLSLSDLKEH